MKTLFIQGIGGASGDMILGAMASLGVDATALEQAVGTLTPEAIRLRAEPCESHGLNGIRVTVEADDVGSPHRHLADVRSLIEGADLPDSVKAQSIQVFVRLAEAEAEVHGTTPDKIHFHEVGALDSIADIVGACLALELLGVDEVVVAPLPIGCGTVECAHGLYPSPAPATTLLLKGFPVVPTDEPYELVTPTGAALLTTWQSGTKVPAGSRIAETGYGFGHRALDGRPNVLRTLIYETGESEDGAECLVMECQVDDTTPELLGALTTKLLRAGALDVFTSSVQMKKQRPGTLLTVLCTPVQREGLLDLLFRESTTFGVREYLTQRTMLARRTEVVQTPFGDVRIKVGTWRGEDVTRAPEMDDCIALAEQRGVAVRRVYEAALNAARGAG